MPKPERNTFNNPPDTTELIRYRATIDKGRGLASGGGFMARIIVPPCLIKSYGGSGGLVHDMGYLIEATEYPGRAFMSGDYRYYGPNFKMPYQTIYDDLNITIQLRDAFQERRFFDDWMDCINPTSTYDFAYRDSYSTTVDIYQFSDVGNASGEAVPVYRIEFQKAYPIRLDPLPALWAEDGYLAMTVAFTYTRWQRENYMNSPSPSQFKLAGSDVDYVDTGAKLPYFLQPRTGNVPTG